MLVVGWSKIFLPCVCVCVVFFASDLDAVAGTPRSREGGVHDVLAHSRRPGARLHGLEDARLQAPVLARVRRLPECTGKFD